MTRQITPAFTTDVDAPPFTSTREVPLPRLSQEPARTVSGDAVTAAAAAETARALVARAAATTVAAVAAPGLADLPDMVGATASAAYSIAGAAAGQTILGDAAAPTASASVAGAPADAFAGNPGGAGFADVSALPDGDVAWSAGDVPVPLSTATATLEVAPPAQSASWTPAAIGLAEAAGFGAASPAWSAASRGLATEVPPPGVPSAGHAAAAAAIAAASARRALKNDPLAGVAWTLPQPPAVPAAPKPMSRVDLTAPDGMVVPPLAPAAEPDAATAHEAARTALVEQQGGSVAPLEPGLPPQVFTPTRRQASFAEFRPDPLLEASFAASSTPTCLVDVVNGRPVVGRANAAFVRLSGWSPAELMGADPLMVAGPMTDAGSLEVLRRAFDTGAAARVAMQGARKDGTAYWSEITILPVRDLSRTLIGAVVEHRDLSRELAAEARGWRGHHVDPTTGLAARSLVEAEITRLCSGAMPFALLSCAVTGLDAVNAVEGEATGDDLLSAAGRRLAEIVGTAGRVGRHTGASYTVIVEGADRAEADHLAARIEQAFTDRPLSAEHAVGMTVGGAVFPDDARGAAALQHAAVRSREEVRRLHGSRWARARARLVRD